MKEYRNKEGQLHRTDGPAIELADGSKYWYLNDQLHRTDGPAIEFADGYKAWHLNAHLHRTDGPAIEYANGDKEWWLNGKLHRTDGPAVERADGYKAWYIGGKEQTPMFFAAIKIVQENDKHMDVCIRLLKSDPSFDEELFRAACEDF
ncbi:MAG: hypothetical protein KGH64_02935 [Candidatus Micrarchaeota archaeon]|nr:hypothetical protein [Candidatus Micrarchaeota archaeon]